MTQHDYLSAAIWEADRHSVTLKSALDEWQAAPCPDMPSLESNPQMMRLVDQILFRFSKLQDAVGNRLVPATLVALSEPVEEWPMIDRLNRLEKLGYLNVDSWLAWRETRNRLAHEYPDHPEIRFAAITSAIADAAALLDCYRHWRNKVSF